MVSFWILQFYAKPYALDYKAH